MHLWLVTVGEPLPTDAGTPRLLRTGMLAERLLARGHTVDWWNSTFDHVAKRHRADRDTTVEVRQGYRFLLLHGPGYRRNVSLRRWANHRVIAAHLARFADIYRAAAPIEIAERPRLRRRGCARGGRAALARLFERGSWACPKR